MCPKDEGQWIQHLSGKTDTDTGSILTLKQGQSLELVALLNFRIFVLGNAQKLTGQDPEETDLTLELALL